MTRHFSKLAVLLILASAAVASCSGCAGHGNAPQMVNGLPTTPPGTPKIPDSVRRQFYANKKLKNGD